MRAATTLSLAVLACALAAPVGAEEGGGDLDDVRRRGVLRHLGIPCAAFVTAGGVSTIMSLNPCARASSKSWTRFVNAECRNAGVGDSRQFHHLASDP